MLTIKELVIPNLYAVFVLPFMMATIKLAFKNISTKKAAFVSLAALLFLIAPSFFNRTMVWLYMKDIVKNYHIINYSSGSGNFPDVAPSMAIQLDLKGKPISPISLELNANIAKNTTNIKKYYRWPSGYKPSGIHLGFSANKRTKDGWFGPENPYVDFDSLVADQEYYYIDLR